MVSAYGRACSANVEPSRGTRILRYMAWTSSGGRAPGGLSPTVILFAGRWPRCRRRGKPTRRASGPLAPVVQAGRLHHEKTSKRAACSTGGANHAESAGPGRRGGVRLAGVGGGAEGQVVHDRPHLGQG